MIDEYYSFYLRDTFRFAKLVNIKFNDIPDLLNDLVELTDITQSINTVNKTTWKYYKNVAGEYHYTDEPMYVYSLDTSEKILFNKENLKLHTETFNSYSNLSVHYYNLVNEYPHQEFLIRCIMYPCDIQKAIDAEEGEILAYPPELIEPHEITLMNDFSVWIKNYLSRWHIKSFTTSDSLYPASYQAILYSLIPGSLLNLRLKRCKTHEAHSFHIRAYLASHGYLDRFYDYLTHEQRLFLYRNILYIERHSGIKQDFYWLIDKILSKRHIPIADFTARQFKGFDEKYYPDYKYRKNPINTEYNVPEKDYFTLEEIKNKEATSAPYNLTYWNEHFNEIDLKIKNSGNGVMLTKDLESNMYDYTNSVPFPLPELLMNEWGYRSYLGGYKVLVDFKHPNKNQTYTITTDIAFIYVTYLLLSKSGIELEKLPTLFFYAINKLNKPSIENIIEHSLLSNSDNIRIAEELLKRMPTSSNFTSRFYFHKYCYEVFLNKIYAWLLISNTHSLDERAYVFNINSKLYSDHIVNFNNIYINPNNLTMKQWLDSYNLPYDGLSDNTKDDIIFNLFVASTNFNSDKTKVLRYIQKAMIGIMKQLTSYSVQYLTDINDLDIYPINWGAIREGNVKFKVDSEYFHNIQYLNTLASTYIRSNASWGLTHSSNWNVRNSTYIDIDKYIEYTSTHYDHNTHYKIDSLNQHYVSVLIRNNAYRILKDGSEINWYLEPVTQEQLNSLMELEWNR